MFFMLPVGVDYQARRYPVVTFTLMGLCTAVYLATLALALSNGTDVYQWTLAHLWLIPGQRHWWTFLTAMFVHGGLLHLVGNLVFLFLFGSCVEDWLGRFRFVVFYLLCGLAADFTHIAFIPSHFASELPMGGASGAISGCIGGFLLLLLKTKIEFKWFFLFFFRFWTGEFFLPAWLVISFWFVRDLLSALLVAASPGESQGVAFGAHVGGMLCGVGLVGLEKLRVNFRPAARIRSAQPAAIFLFLDGAQTGPFTLAQVRQMLSLGSIPEGTFYWKEGMEDWRTTEELRGTGGA
jgi:membrane associated rhomboid family serine protease